MHSLMSLVLFSALMTLIISRGTMAGESPRDPRQLHCSDRTPPPLRDCLDAIAHMPTDGGYHHGGSYEFAKTEGNVPSPRPHNYTLPLSPTVRLCKIIVDLDHANPTPGVYTDWYSWGQLHKDVEEAYKTCLLQIRREGYVTGLGRSGRILLSIEHIRYFSPTPPSVPNGPIGGNLTLPLGSDNLVSDSSATS